MFNNYFLTVSTDDNRTTPIVIPVAENTIEPLVISDAGILNLLLNLDPKKACGPGDISNNFCYDMQSGAVNTSALDIANLLELLHCHLNGK